MSTPFANPDFPVPPVSPIGSPAWGVALLFPHQGSWSEEAYLALNTNRMVELSNGCVEVLPMPTVLHQLMAIFLFERLKQFVLQRAKGLVLIAPCPIRLKQGTIREPDVLFLKPERVRLKEPPDGADLVIEIVSEGREARERDLLIKRAEYALAGISEYWIVDPEQQSITVLALSGQQYQEHGIYHRDDDASSVLLPGFAISVTELFSVGDQLA